MGDAAALALVERRWRGLQRLRRRLNDSAMGYEGWGGYELLPETHLADRSGSMKSTTSCGRCSVKRCFHSTTRACATAVSDRRSRRCSEIHWKRRCIRAGDARALARLAAEQGIEIHTGAQVQALDETGTEVRIRVAGARGLGFRAPRVAVCTNGITGALLPDAGIVPARGQVLVTAPIAGLPWRGTYHLDQGFFYFRNVGARVLLGGGRNLDIAAEATTDMALTDTVQTALERLLHGTILPDRECAIEHRWSGVMGFFRRQAADRAPRIGTHCARLRMQRDGRGAGRRDRGADRGIAGVAYDSVRTKAGS